MPAGEFDYIGGAAKLYDDGNLMTESTGFQSPGNTSDTDSLSWPVSTIPWRLESSLNLLNFDPSPSIPDLENNTFKIEEAMIPEKMFYRLTRP
ncbi:hypothetical protein OAF06_00510 [Akkermansiaceae bacterium]|nr:hypothetical protein [Akkermansiaceae bacterium]MDB4283426.1 hypothetical protein [Akkermansiaceae bacterium]MDB4667242.1 hypothetical protein [Akkermansiaceae bacterium]MDB4781888.1 hypothetical protein [Akkermansiaceae bacterium]MDC0274630.1 hypothetical protein [Akkermansiaceae bacterium]